MNRVTWSPITEPKVAKKFKSNAQCSKECHQFRSNLVLSKNDDIQIHQNIGMWQDLIQNQVHIHLLAFSFIEHANDKKVYFLRCH